MALNGFIVINAAKGPAKRPHVHATIPSAHQEASRIASANPGVKVYVLKVVGYAISRDVVWVDEHGNEHDNSSLQDDVLESEIPF